MKKIVFTEVQIYKVFKKFEHNYQIKYPQKELNIENFNSILGYLNKQTKLFNHCAGLSDRRKRKIYQSILINIIELQIL